MRQVQAPKAEPLITMNTVVVKRLIPWATTRKSVRKLFTRSGGLRYFVGQGKKQKRFYTTVDWVNEYVEKVKRNR